MVVEALMAFCHNKVSFVCGSAAVCDYEPLEPRPALSCHSAPAEGLSGGTPETSKRIEFSTRVS
jgi:hypothetical protein